MGLVSGLAWSPNTGPTTLHTAGPLADEQHPWHFTYRFQEQEWSSRLQVWGPCRATTTTTTITTCVCWWALLLSFLEIQMIFCQPLVVTHHNNMQLIWFLHVFHMFSYPILDGGFELVFRIGFTKPSKPLCCSDETNTHHG